MAKYKLIRRWPKKDLVNVKSWVGSTYTTFTTTSTYTTLTYNAWTRQYEITYPVPLIELEEQCLYCPYCRANAVWKDGQGCQGCGRLWHIDGDDIWTFDRTVEALFPPEGEYEVVDEGGR